MAARSCDLEHRLGAFLAFYVLQVGHRPAIVVETWLGAGKSLQAIRVIDQRENMRGG